MPHCVVEYAKDIEQNIVIKELVSLVHRSVLESGLFEESSIKTRAIEFSHYQTGLSDIPFIHLTLKILQGRNHQQKKALTTLVMERLGEILQAPMTLTIEVIDVEKVSYKKLVLN